MPFQLKAEHRGVIAQRLAAGVSREAIAVELHHHVRSIEKEIQRNSIDGVYCPVQAQKLTEKRRRDGRKKCRKMEQPENVAYVKERLAQYWSPDQIAGRSRREFPDNRRRQLSRQLVYSWLGKYDHAQSLRKCLRRAACSRHRHAKPHEPPARSVVNRPKIVDDRDRDGDWEMDTIFGLGRAGLLSMVERRSGFLSLLPLAGRRALLVRQACCGRLTQLPAELRQSITLDNGPEFGQPELLEKAVGLSVYKTQPHCPWQRGCIENLNGLVRQWFPKRTCFTAVTRYQINKVEHALNNRPRKRLNYQTPSEVFQQQCQRALQT
jgi:transposase, IS30 family